MLVGATLTSTCNAGLIFSFATNVGSFSTTPTANSTIGYSFTVSNTIDIDGLAFWDQGNDGISAHNVRLWTSSQVLLSSAVVDGSSAVDNANGLGSWRVAPVAVLSLTPGTYVIGADVGANTDAIWLGTTVSSAPGTSYLEARELDSAFGFPTGNLGPSGSYLGPNLRIANVTAVPEPSSMALLGIAGLGFGWRKLRKKTAKAS